MKRKNVFSLKLFGAAAILCITAFSCTSNDTDSSATTTDSSASTSVTDTPMMSKTTDTASTAMKMTGTAKPNPAKKGMKGKVTISQAPPMSPEAKMEADASGIYSNVEIIPSFPGGNKGLQKYFDNNLKYPEEAGNDGVEGTVTLSFVVDENGKLSAPQIVGERVGYGLDEEALRVVSTMPTWNPGKLKGKNVKTRFTLPVRFVLE